MWQSFIQGMGFWLGKAAAEVALFLVFCLATAVVAAAIVCWPLFGRSK